MVVVPGTVVLLTVNYSTFYTRMKMHKTGPGTFIKLYVDLFVISMKFQIGLWSSSTVFPSNATRTCAHTHITLKYMPLVCLVDSIIIFGQRESSASVVGSDLMVWWRIIRYPGHWPRIRIHKCHRQCLGRLLYRSISSRIWHSYIGDGFQQILKHRSTLFKALYQNSFKLTSLWSTFRTLA